VLIRNAEELKNFSKGEEEQLEKVRLKLLLAVCVYLLLFAFGEF